MPVARTTSLMIASFRGDYFFLSNFFPTRAGFDGTWYRSAEHAYQASKFDDWDYQQLFLDGTLSPSAARWLGNALPLKNPKDWEVRRIFNMRDVLQTKFEPGSQLAGMLLSTGDHELVEGNTWNDTFWGKVGPHGDNWLGRLLMLQREDLRRDRESLY